MSERLLAVLHCVLNFRSSNLWGLFLYASVFNITYINKSGNVKSGCLGGRRLETLSQDILGVTVRQR
jgi:hypothetical protein